MSDNPVFDYWNALQGPLASLLPQGFTGRTHLLKVARAALASGDPGMHPLAVDALLTAFAESPLDGVFAGQLLNAPEVVGLLPHETRQVLRAVVANWREPRGAEYLNRLAARKDIPRIKSFIERQASSDPENLYWVNKGLFFGLVDNDPEWVEPLLPNVTEGPEARALATAKEQIARFKGEPCDPDSLIDAAGTAYGSWGSLHGGLRLAAEGYRDEAVLWLMQAFAAAPWNAGLLLRLHDMLGSVDIERADLPGRTVVLLYSWNKRDDLNGTLASLFMADADPDIMVLDNGSTDGTGEMLDEWERRFNETRAGRLAKITLPVNVGAPAARNWLRDAALGAGYDFICYLDDDVVLPQDWLETLGAAVVRYPEASVWGCKVVDHDNPFLIQHADHLLEIPEQGTGDPELFVQTLDAGLFDYVRPCDSVTGCCHLFRAAILQESGGFDIRLSPSQYDDLEHDIRLLKAGGHIVYQGHLVVRHRKRSGLASHTSPQAEGNALGNKFKLQAIHGNDELKQLQDQGRQRLLKDLRDKASHLGLMLDITDVRA